MGKTQYVVLEKAQNGPDAVQELWSLYDVGVEATSAAGALRLALKDKGNLGKSYVAVPQRSWQPQSVKMETQQRLKIG